ncbi:hypothetical protein [Mesonia aquimarina]|uniref:hypothetical protein n=1 Tax=Mesonia aquimarina TaxID=1504967 RepID=UPI000EF5986F|nr:hypothetical protein [Mesonia aquimarina]
MAIEEIDLGISPDDGNGDELRVGGAVINSNFAYLESLADNVNIYKYAFVDFDDPLDTAYTTQIADYINNNANGGFTKLGNQNVFIHSTKYVSGNPTDPNNVLSAVTYVWRFDLGKGVWGNGGNAVSFASFSFVGSYQEGAGSTINYDLLTQTSTTVEDVVNASGPYVIPAESVVKFEINLDGEDQVYYYVGETQILIGNGETQVDSSNFILTGDITPSPPSPTDYITQQQLSDSFYDNHAFSKQNNLSDFDYLTDKFYILATAEPNFYFASKKTNDEDFIGSRIHIGLSNAKFDLEQPDTSSVSGYKVWELGVISGAFEEGELYGFQAWFCRKNISEKFDSKTFTYNGTDNTFALPDVAVKVLNVFIGQGVYPDQVPNGEVTQVTVDSSLLFGSGVKVTIQYIKR